MTCSCGVTFTARHKASHEKSKRHQEGNPGLYKIHELKDRFYFTYTLNGIRKECQVKKTKNRSQEESLQLIQEKRQQFIEANLE